MYFRHFLANVSCRISRASGGFTPLPPPWLCLGFVWGFKMPTPDLQLQGGHCMLCLQQNIHTSCNLQTTDSGKDISILMRKLREKWMEIIKNSGKMMLKILYEPCIYPIRHVRAPILNVYTKGQSDSCNLLKKLT